MFERRNQSILTPHYSALVSHDDDEDEVFTLARKDHALEGEGDDLADGDLDPTAPGAPLISSEDLSKRKLKAGASKKQSIRNKPTGEKLVFDEEGQATDFYKSGRQEEELGGAEEARREFQERERERMREVSKIDREVARAARMEKKRKRKDKEREVSFVLSICARRSRLMCRREDLTQNTATMGDPSQSSLVLMTTFPSRRRRKFSSRRQRRTGVRGRKWKQGVSRMKRHSLSSCFRVDRCMLFTRIQSMKSVASRQILLSKQKSIRCIRKTRTELPKQELENLCRAKSLRWMDTGS